jgi:hypothetical protein
LLDKHVERLLARFHVSTLVFEYNYSYHKSSHIKVL